MGYIITLKCMANVSIKKNSDFGVSALGETFWERVLEENDGCQVEDRYFVFHAA